jgi:hypothetical protein
VVESPLAIFFELIFGLMVRIAESILFAAVKFFELFAALTFFARSSLLAFILSAVILAVISYFILRFIFSSSMTLTALVIFIILLFLTLGFLAATI